jgi:replicative DNA helicase
MSSEEDVLKAVQDSFPDIAFKDTGNAWVATAGTTPCCTHPAVDHLYLYPDPPHGLKCHRCGKFTPVKGSAIAVPSPGFEVPVTNPDTLSDLHLRVQKACADDLWSDLPWAEPTRKYLRNRGLTDEYLRKNGFGVVPSMELLAARFPGEVAQLKEAGYQNPLLAGRVLYPYLDGTGAVIGYGARLVVDPEDGFAAPKYLFSPGLKKIDLYRLSQIDSAQPVVVVEGQLSADIMAAQGITNVVGIGGSTVTKAQAESLLRHGVATVTLALDYDPPKRAGDAGTEASIKNLHQAGVTVRVLPPIYLRDAASPEVKVDPDSYLMAKDVAALNQLLKDSITTPERYLLERRLEGLPVTTSVGAEEALRRTGALLSEIASDEAGRQLLLRDVAEMIALPLQAVQERVAACEVAAAESKRIQAVRATIRRADELVSSGKPEEAAAILERAARDTIALQTVVQPFGFFNRDQFLAEAGHVPSDLMQLGWAAIDEQVNLVSGELCVIASRPRHGKTTAAMNIMINALDRRESLTHVFFTHEMPTRFLLARMATIHAHKHTGIALSAKTHVIAHYRPRPDGTRDFPNAINAAFDSFDGWGSVRRMLVINEPGWRVADMRRALDQLIEDGVAIGSVIIDYLEMIPPPGRSESREQQVGQNIHDCRLIANALNIPLIVLSQFSRDGSGQPTLEGLRYSGQIEQEASVVLGLYNPAVEEPPQDVVIEDSFREVEVHILKNRTGQQSRRKLHYHPRSGLMVENASSLSQAAFAPKRDAGAVEQE